jgi:hypothetical protein
VNIVGLRTWIGSADTDRWDQAENWSEHIVPQDGESIRITMSGGKAALTPIFPADFNVADLYVAGDLGGGPIVVNGGFRWECGHISANLELKGDGSVIAEEGLILSGIIKCASNLVFAGGKQIFLDGGEVSCDNNAAFSDCGLRGSSRTPSRFTSLNFYINGSSRFSGRGLVVERASDGIFCIRGELFVDEGAKLLWNKGAVGGMGILNLKYDATMETEQSDSTGAGCGWFEVIPWHTTARFQLFDGPNPAKSDL